MPFERKCCFVLSLSQLHHISDLRLLSFLKYEISKGREGFIPDDGRSITHLLNEIIVTEFLCTQFLFEQLGTQITQTPAYRNNFLDKVENLCARETR